MNPSWGMVGALVLAAALRGYPLFARHCGYELQEFYPRNAVVALVQGDWQPWALVHGAGLFDVLRALYSVGFGLGTITGRFGERIDVLGAFVQDPLPFIVVGRLVMLAASLATVWCASAIAYHLAGRVAAVAAAITLASCTIHVRESLNVWPDALAALPVTVAVWLALVTRGRTTGAAIAVGVLAGIALASKHAAVLVACPVAIGLLDSFAWSTWRRMIVAGLVTIAVYFALCPHTILGWDLLRSQMRFQSSAVFSLPGERTGLPFGALFPMAFGLGPAVLAGVGLMRTAIATPRDALVVAGFPVLYLASIAAAKNPFARYMALAAPFIAVFAGVGVRAITGWLAPRTASVAAALLVAIACAGPAANSWAHVRLLARPDTRVLAGAWLREHVPAGAAVTLPNLAIFPNPVLGPDAAGVSWDLATWRDRLVARGLVAATPAFDVHHLGLLDQYDPAWEPRDPVVVTASHPAPVGFRTPDAFVGKLQRANYTAVARFDAIVEPPAAGVRYDPLEAGFVPLAGARWIDRPGPNLVVWRRNEP